MTTVPTSRPLPTRPLPPRSRLHAATPGGRSGPVIDPFRVLRRYMLLIVCAGIGGVMLGFGLYFVLSITYPLYSAQVLFEIRPALVDATSITPPDTRYGDLITRQQETETVLLTSREVLGRAAQNPEIRSTAWHAKFIDSAADGSQSFLLDDAVDDLIDDVLPVVPTDTTLFGVSWSAGRAQDVPVVLNSIANAYSAKRKELDEAILIDNLKLFQNELSRTTAEIEDLSLEIENFVRDRGITSLDDPRYSQVAIALNDLNEKIADAKSNATAYQSAYMQTAAKLEGKIEPDESDVAAAKAHSLVAIQEKSLTELSTELRLARERYQPDYPSLVNLENRYRATELEYQQKLDEIVKRNLDSKLRSLGSELERVQKVLEDLEKDYEAKEVLLRDLAADFSRYQDLERRREMLSAKRDSQLEMIRELDLMRFRADAARVRLAQSAQTPRSKSFPNPLIIVPLCTVACLAITIGLIFLRELTDQRVKSASDLELVPGARVLGVIPELGEDPTQAASCEVCVFKHPHSVVAESYRQAAHPIAELMERSNHQTLLLVGGLPGTGTTTTASNLAAAQAATGRRVVAIDANFRRPNLAPAMGATGDHVGLGELLHGESSLDEVIQQSPCGADVIGAGHPSRRVFERLNTQQLARVLAELRDRYDLILIDAPPAVAAGDAMMLANKVDATVLVIRAHQEQRGLVARLVSRLSEGQSELLGIILNRPRGTAGGYFKRNYATMAAYATKAESA
jgi:capsular exopolysaccharide synthesis family protein